MTRTHLIPNPTVRLTALAVCALLIGGVAVADDRDLVKSSGENPYLFVIFDTSGSMNWTPPDPGPDGVLGTGDDLAGDRWAPAYGDDPNSKFYQAKSALFQVVNDPDLQEILWGFATYNDDDVRAFRKHYLYSPVQAPPWADDLPYPMPAMPKHFGDTCMDDADSGGGCDLDASSGELAWDGTNNIWVLGTCGSPQDLADPESFGELLALPVLGASGNQTVIEWVRWQGREFEVRWDDIDLGSYGDDTITVHLTVRERDGCGSWLVDWGHQHVEFTKTYAVDNNGRDLPGANEMLIWQQDNHTDSFGAPAGFYDPSDTSTTNTCAGWDPNNDSFSDATVGVNLKYQTTSDPLGRHAWAFNRGDVIPFDWQDEAAWGAGSTNRSLILKRLAPSYDGSDPATADFRVAPYLEDLPDTFYATNSQGRLAPKAAYVNTPPLLPSGSTPIGNSMYDFMQWYDQWKPVADGANGDPRFGCRTVNLLILSDGDETCYGGGTGGTTDSQGDRNPCWIADRLLNENNRDIRTFIIGFGVPGANANFLNCIAQRGGTDAIDLNNDGIIDLTGPILPGNEQELVAALKQVANAVKSTSRSFASAAVPQAQVNVEDKVYLTSFIPFAGEPIWPGRLDAYLRPVPLQERDVILPDGSVETRLVPDPTKGCLPGDEANCHLWNAADELLAQAADDTQLCGNGGDCSFNLGLAEDQRRVYYATDRADLEVPGNRRDLKILPTDTDALWADMVWGMDIDNCETGDIVCTQDPGYRALATDYVDFVHRQKDYEDPNNSGVYLNFLLGDFFHSDPLVYGNPDNFAYWVGDVEGSGSLPLEDPCTASPSGYRCYFAKQRYRRKVIFAGTNDFQFHAFDAGFFRGPNDEATANCESNPVTNAEFVVGDFDNGTGRELFSWVPRGVLPRIEPVSTSEEQQFSVDGRIARGDVFIDPVQAAGVPSPDEREWRSTIIGTLREGGSSMFALDITQPDKLNECDDLEQIPEARSGADDFVPSCIDGGIGCGTTRYPELLWEFTDNRDCITEVANTRYLDWPGDPANDGAVRCDDDFNGTQDLAYTWSRPTISRLRVIVDGDLVDRYVAVFGGGMDPRDKTTDGSVPADIAGNFLYMVDMETGRVLYKRVVVGAVAADPAVVDTDQNGYADTIYFGTTAGYLYKVDISAPQAVVDLGVNGGLRVTASAWDPFPILSTAGRPIFHEPTVIFVPDLGLYAVAIGTGDREDLWLDYGVEGRFYMFVDRNFVPGDPTLPRVEGDFQEVALTDSNTSADYLRQAPYGWFLRLEVEERFISEAFSLAGVTIFSTFEPLENISEDGTICQRYGNSRVYVVTTTSGNGLLSGDERLFVIEGGFLSPPFAETSTTKNPGGGGGSNADELPDDLVGVVEEIKKLLPDNCKYANYTINLKAVRDDTGIQFLAAIPVCTVEANWRDF